MLRKIFLLSLFSLNFNANILGAAKKDAIIAALNCTKRWTSATLKSPLVSISLAERSVVADIDRKYVTSYWPRIYAFRDLVDMKAQLERRSEQAQAQVGWLSKAECSSESEFNSAVQEIKHLADEIKEHLHQINYNVDTKLLAIKADDKFAETLVHHAAWEAERERMRAQIRLNR